MTLATETDAILPTRVIVAHRPETIASASRVIVLHEGRIAQDLRSVPGGGSTHAR